MWFRALSKWSSVSGVSHTWGVLLHLSSLLQWPLMHSALWPVRPPPQSLLEQLHLPDTLQWNGLLQMPDWWASIRPQSLILIVLFFCFSLLTIRISMHHFVQEVPVGRSCVSSSESKTNVCCPPQWKFVCLSVLNMRYSYSIQRISLEKHICTNFLHCCQERIAADNSCQRYCRYYGYILASKKAAIIIIAVHFLHLYTVIYLILSWWH